MHDGTFDPKQLIPSKERQEAVALAREAGVGKQKKTTEEPGESRPKDSDGRRKKVKDKSGSRSRSRRPNNDGGSISNGSSIRSRSRDDISTRSASGRREDRNETRDTNHEKGDNNRNFKRKPDNQGKRNGKK
jgi:hypothetical protein